jgi:hypothetical protein
MEPPSQAKAGCEVVIESLLCSGKERTCQLFYHKARRLSRGKIQGKMVSAILASVKNLLTECLRDDIILI